MGTTGPRKGGDRRREAIVAFVREYWARNGYGPSQRDIAVGVGLFNHATASYHVGLLVEAGVLAMTPRVARSLRVVDAPTGLGAMAARTNDSGLSVGAVEMHSREPL